MVVSADMTLLHGTGGQPGKGRDHQGDTEGAVASRKGSPRSFGPRSRRWLCRGQEVTSARAFGVRQLAATFTPGSLLPLATRVGAGPLLLGSEAGSLKFGHPSESDVGLGRHRGSIPLNPPSKGDFNRTLSGMGCPVVLAYPKQSLWKRRSAETRLSARVFGVRPARYAPELGIVSTLINVVCEPLKSPFEGGFRGMFFRYQLRSVASSEGNLGGPEAGFRRKCASKLPHSRSGWYPRAPRTGDAAS